MNYMPSFKRINWGFGFISIALIGIITYYIIAPLAGYLVVSEYSKYINNEEFPVLFKDFISYLFFSKFSFLLSLNNFTGISNGVNFFEAFKTIPELYNIYTNTLYILTVISCLVVSRFAFFKSSDEILTEGMGCEKDPKVAQVKAKAAADEMIKQDKKGLLFHPGWKKKDAIHIPFNSETRHFFFGGASGCGKTQALQHMMKGAIYRGDKVVIFDYKGDFTSMLPAWQPEGVKSLLFAPWDKRSAQWNIGSDLKEFTDAELISQSLIPHTGGDEYWTTGPRDILTSILIGLTVQIGKWNIKDLAAILSSSTLMKQVAAEYRPAAAEHIAGDSGQTQGVLGSIRAAGQGMDSWARLTNPDDDGFSLTNWVNDPNPEHTVLLISGRQKMPWHYPTCAAMLSTIMAEALSLEDDADRRIWIFADELGRMPKIEFLEPAMTAGRSKGLCMVLGIQDYGKLKSTYGDELADTIISQCGTKILGKMNGGQTQQWAQSEFGEMVVERLSTTNQGGGGQQQGDLDAAMGAGANQSTSWQRDQRATVLGSEFRKLPPSIKIGGPQFYCALDWLETEFVKLHWPYSGFKKVRPSLIRKPELAVLFDENDHAGSILKSDFTDEEREAMKQGKQADTDSEQDKLERMAEAMGRGMVKGLAGNSNSEKQEHTEETESITIGTVNNDLMNELASNDEKSAGDEMAEQALGEAAEMALGGSIGVDAADHMAELVDSFESTLSKKPTRTTSGHKSRRRKSKSKNTGKGK